GYEEPALSLSEGNELNPGSIPGVVRLNRILVPVLPSPIPFQLEIRLAGTAYVFGESFGIVTFRHVPSRWAVRRNLSLLGLRSFRSHRSQRSMRRKREKVSYSHSFFGDGVVRVCCCCPRPWSR